MSRAAAAVKMLEAHVTGTRELVDQLSYTLDALRILALYRKYFPTEFGRLRVDWLDQDQVLGACGEFTQLVDLNLFPCHSPVIEEYEGSRLDEMLLYAPWPAWWEGYDLSLLERLILEALGEIDAHGEPLYRLYAGAEPKPCLEKGALESLCASRRTPLKHLPAAVAMVLKDTGNVWCDVTEEEVGQTCSFPEWTERNIKHFSAQWVAAKQIFGKFRELETWLKEKQERHQAIRRLIGKAMKQPQAAGGPGSLCDTLSDVLDREVDDDNFEE